MCVTIFQVTTWLPLAKDFWVILSYSQESSVVKAEKKKTIQIPNKHLEKKWNNVTSQIQIWNVMQASILLEG